jgi:hypothetical protein
MMEEDVFAGCGSKRGKGKAPRRSGCRAHGHRPKGSQGLAESISLLSNGLGGVGVTLQAKTGQRVENSENAPPVVQLNGLDAGCEFFIL